MCVEWSLNVHVAWSLPTFELQQIIQGFNWPSLTCSRSTHVHGCHKRQDGTIHLTCVPYLRVRNLPSDSYLGQGTSEDQFLSTNDLLCPPNLILDLAIWGSFSSQPIFLWLIICEDSSIEVWHSNLQWLFLILSNLQHSSSAPWEPFWSPCGKHAYLSCVGFGWLCIQAPVGEYLESFQMDGFCQESLTCLWVTENVQLKNTWVFF